MRLFHQKEAKLVFLPLYSSEVPSLMYQSCELLCWESTLLIRFSRSSHPKVFLGKGGLKICSKFTGEHQCQNVISIKLQSNFIEITVWHGCFLVNCSIFSEPLFLRTPLYVCFWILHLDYYENTKAYPEDCETS